MEQRRVSDTWESGVPYERVPVRADGSILLTARAWATRATVKR
jgi:hypothetical protein